MTESPNELIGTYFNSVAVELSKSCSDIPIVLEIEQECWPKSEESYVSESDSWRSWQATRERFESRQEKNALYVARCVNTDHYRSRKSFGAENGRVMGHLTAYRCGWTDADTVKRILMDDDIDWEKIVRDCRFPPNFDDATYGGWLIDAYSSESDVMHLISINVPCCFRGDVEFPGGISTVANILTAGLRDHATSIGVKYIVGITTLPGYAGSGISLDEYVRRKRQDGALFDPNLRRYKREGAEIICPAPNYMPCDRKSAGHGALVVYTL
jgi:hypothetical protein